VLQIDCKLDKSTKISMTSMISELPAAYADPCRPSVMYDIVLQRLTLYAPHELRLSINLNSAKQRGRVMMFRSVLRPLFSSLLLCTKYFPLRHSACAGSLGTWWTDDL